MQSRVHAWPLAPDCGSKSRSRNETQKARKVSAARQAQSVTAAPDRSDTGASPRIAVLTPMYKHILIATDGSELAAKAVAAGLRLAKVHRAKVTITVSEPWSMAGSSEGSVTVPFDAYEQAAAAAAADVLGSVHKLANHLDVDCVTAHIKNHPAEGIVDTAQGRAAISSSWLRTAGAGFRASCSAVRRLVS